MIEKFSVENFKGFKEKIVFDLSKTRDYTFNNDLIKNGIVNKGIIYGKNGSGKSNLGYALYDITLHLTDKPKPIGSYFAYYTNLFSVSKPAIFTYEFNFDGRKITYLYKKTNFNQLIYEEVKEDNKILISCDYTKLKDTIINVAGAENLRVDLLGNQLSILKYIYKNTPPNDSSPITKIVKFAEGMLWFRSLSDGNEFVGYSPES
ncbi:MAG: AAA family ATPase, partial [Bacilli bacterium]